MHNIVHIFRWIYEPVGAWLRKLMRGNVTLTAFFKIVRRWPNKQFREYISQYRIPTPMPEIPQPNYAIANLPVCRLGPKNRGKVIMLLENQSYHAGFCAVWTYFLNRLTFSDRMGFCHCINWNQSDFYQEKKPVNGATSIFEYYFQQPAGISVADAKRSDSVIFDYNCPQYDFDSVFHVGVPTDYKFTDKDIEDFAVIQRKYIHLHPALERKINRQIGALLNGGRTLGVHARGGDSKVGYKNHPVPVQAVDYLLATKKAVRETKVDQIFLATDDADILTLFQDEFGEKLVYYQDVIRSRGTVMNCYAENERKLHHYKLGVEIIRDVYTLAACDSFICGMSYVSFMTQVVKRSKKERFLYFERLFYGLAKEGVDLTSAEDREKVGQAWAKELTEQKVDPKNKDAKRKPADLEGKKNLSQGKIN